MKLDSWLIDLRGLVKTCGYGTSVDSVLRDQIVLGVADPLVLEKLLYEKNLFLPPMPFRVGQWTESLIGSLSRRSELNLIGSRQQVNGHISQQMRMVASSIPGATSAVVIIRKINVV